MSETHTYLLTNRVENVTTRRDTLDGADHLVVENVAVAKPMDLAGGYIPSTVWQNTAPEWNGTPLPVGHPSDTYNNYVTANAPSVREQAVIGTFYNAEYDDASDELVGELWINVEKASDLGGHAGDVLDQLQNGEGLEVSTAYRGVAGDAGTYDGEYHENVLVDVRPDHIALLPNDLGPGRCSKAEGCGVPTDVAATEVEANDASGDLAFSTDPTADAATTAGTAVLCVNTTDDPDEIADDTAASGDAGADADGDADGGESQPAVPDDIDAQLDDMSQTLAERAVAQFRAALGVGNGDDDAVDTDTDTDADAAAATETSGEAATAHANCDCAGGDGSDPCACRDGESSNDRSGSGTESTDSDDPATSNSDATPQSTTTSPDTEPDTMTEYDGDYDLETLANDSPFSEDELADMDEDRLAFLSNSTESAAADAETETAGDDSAPQTNADADADGSTESTGDVDADAGGDPALDPADIDVNALADAVGDHLADDDRFVTSEDFQPVAEFVNEQEQADKRDAVDTILENTDHWEEDELLAKPADELDRLADMAQPDQPVAGNAGQQGGADFGVFPGAQPDGTQANDDDESDGEPATAGTMADFMEANDMSFGDD